MDDDYLYIAEKNALSCTTIDGTVIFKTATNLSVSNMAVSSKIVIIIGCCALNGAIQVFDRDGRHRQTFKVKDMPWGIAFDGSGHQFACSSDHGIVAVYSCEYQCRQLIQWDTFDSRGIRALVWLNDSELCTGANSGRIAIWDVATGQQLRELQAASPLDITRLARVPYNPNVLITGHNPGIVRIWNLHDASYREAKPHTGWISVIIFNEALNLVVTCSDDRQVVGFDFESLEVRWIQPVVATPLSLALHSGEIFVGMWNEAVVVLDVQDGTRRRVFPSKSNGAGYITSSRSSALHRPFQFVE